MRLHPSSQRSGVSLLESLIAGSIFFIAIVAINQLLDSAGQQALKVRQQSIGGQLAQSKLNEVVAGVVTLSNQSGSFDEFPDWEWNVEATQHEVTGLWRVRVRVGRAGATEADEVMLDQFVLDPTKRGSTMDAASITGSDTMGTDTSTGSSSSGSSGGTSTPSTGGSSAPPSTGGSGSQPRSR